MTFLFDKFMDSDNIFDVLASYEPDNASTPLLLFIRYVPRYLRGLCITASFFYRGNYIDMRFFSSDIEIFSIDMGNFYNDIGNYNILPSTFRLLKKHISSTVH